VANYRQVTLTAFQEVEDNLAALRVLEEEARSEDDAVEAARLSLVARAEPVQGRHGELFSTWLTAQTAALTRSATPSASRRGASPRSVALIQALGGGWRES
jgi:outer membrane protein TolC